ncbi:MAG: Acetoin dehydrogenase operon transcriptional activator AcoR [Syntrophus sp. SKADARSKE-3]|nr:Acetoin dehydrogenase operon transcriptional activator AcoR [Syntrophus sp. SKADARSKE-3]
MDHVERYNAIYSEWKKFINGMPINDLIVSPVVSESWERSKRNGVDPYLKELPVIDEERIREVLSHNKELIEISQPYMKNLHSFVQGSGFIVGLSDVNTYMLEILGDRDVQEYLKGRRFSIGCCWSEKVTGTNAIGTATQLGRAIQIRASENYCRGAQKWTSSAAPIHDPDGRLVGVISITGPYQKTNPHTLGLAVAVAYAIENEIKLRDTLNKLQIAHSFQNTVMSSMPECVVSIDNEGAISVVNKSFQNTFGRYGETLTGRNLADVFGHRNKGILNLIKRNDSLTDINVRIASGNTHGEYTLSCYPIFSFDGMIGKVIVINEIKRAKTLATKMMGANAQFNFDDIVGRNLEFLNTIRQAQIASKIESNVLLLGESGTGKDIVAQAIHNDSYRNGGPYVAINCATIPRDLITSDLFGYSEGAFTGSRKGGSQGKFELADGGTIFLDEIAEAPLELQAALLRVIEDKSIIRIGGTRVRKIDVRIIAATNKNLKEEVRKGNFREDLYYRLNVFTISIPPLRERKDDLLLLVNTFVQHIGRRMGKVINKIDDDIFRMFKSYSWPGNVRELQNILERMINIANTDSLSADLLPSELTDVTSPDMKNVMSPVDRIEQEMIEELLKSNIPKKEIAMKLGMARSTLYRRLNNY